MKPSRGCSTRAWRVLYWRPGRAGLASPTTCAAEKQLWSLPHHLCMFTHCSRQICSLLCSCISEVGTYLPTYLLFEGIHAHFYILQMYVRWKFEREKTHCIGTKVDFLFREICLNQMCIKSINTGCGFGYLKIVC